MGGNSSSGGRVSMSAVLKHQPFWWEGAPPTSSAPEEVAPASDVAIVGAGYTGLSAAITLARAGRSVQVFDAMRPGEGASTRNGGIASGSLRFSLKSAMARFGETKALAMYREGVAAREDLRDFIKREELDCDYAEVGRFTGALRPDQLERQAHEVDLLNKYFNLGAYIVPPDKLADEVGTEIYCGGDVRPDIATLHPAKLHAAMRRIASEAGVRIHGHTPVLSYMRESGRFAIETIRGKTASRDLLVATNGYGNSSNRWLRRRIVPIASCIVATEPLSDNLIGHLLPKGRAMGEQRKLYRYYRLSPDGRRILLGARQPALAPTPERSAAHIRGLLTNLFPQLKDVGISHAWQGYVAFSKDEIPRLFEHRGVHYAGAYCGSGVVWARWLGKKAAYKILDSVEAASAFDGPAPSSIPLYSGRPWFLPPMILWQGIQDRLGIGSKT